MTTTQRIQVWTTGFRGSVIEYRGDVDGPDCEVLDGTEWRLATDDERRAVRIERTAERLADREIYCCDSGLVDTHMRLAGSEGFPHELYLEWSWDNVVNLRPDPSQWDYDQCREWLTDEGHVVPEDAIPHVAVEYDTEYSGGNYSGTGEVEYIPESACDDWNDTVKVHEAFTKATGHDAVHIVHYSPDERVTADGSTWDEEDATELMRDAVRDEATDAEVLEWWRVSSWLAAKLTEIGEPVLDNEFGEWYGRTTSGQGILMDGVLQRVAATLEK